MTTISERSKNENLVLFSDYIGKRATGKDSPVTIKAADLDKNFNRLTVIENPAEKDGERSYTVKYDKDGTILEITALPKGSKKGDILYWNPADGGGKWVVLPAPSGSNISIKQFDVCENGAPKTLNMLVWETD
jgi:hypothetical protein